MAFSPGARLGPYEVVSALGAGGMAEVYRARDTRLDRTVAIKVLPSEVAGNPDLRARFEREARANGQRFLINTRIRRRSDANQRHPQLDGAPQEMKG